MPGSRWTRRASDMWRGLDGRRRRDVVVGTLAAAFLIAITLLAVAGRQPEDDSLFASFPTTLRPTTTRLAPVPSTFGGLAGLPDAQPGVPAEATPSTAPAGTGAPDAGAGTPLPSGSRVPDIRTSGIGGGIAGEPGEPAAAGGRAPMGAGEGTADAGGTVGETTTSTTTAAPPAPVSDPITVTVTGADDGRTFELRSGDVLVVQLGPGWSIPSSDSDALIRTSTSQVDTGVTARFTASGFGTAHVTSGGDAPCTTANPPCLGTQMSFRVTVDVGG